MRQVQEEELELVSGGVEDGGFEDDFGFEWDEMSSSYLPKKRKGLTPP